MFIEINDGDMLILQGLVNAKLRELEPLATGEVKHGEDKNEWHFKQENAKGMMVALHRLKDKLIAANCARSWLEKENDQLKDRLKQEYKRAEDWKKVAETR